ncbi:MAG: metallophosphoesterase family protein [Lachnospiraceae bacterium]|nr:metallophosphoesterase family protein [Lachnospiraceae bacterium]
MKVALIADCHFGIKKSDIPFMESQLRFYKEQFVPELKHANIKDIFILGDVFDTRQTINVQTINVVIDLFKNILKDFNISIIVGNHDMYMTTTTDINSLKILDILPNVTVYEKQTVLTIDSKTILLQPWITDYSTYILTEHYDYAFMHADIIGFDQGGGRLSESGLMAKELLKKVDAVYTGHYHNGIHRQFEKGKSVTYLGAPYQLTRIDRGGTRGYHILDIATGERTMVENKVSMKFTRHIYPDVNLDVIAGNVVDLDIPAEYNDQTKKISVLVTKLERLKPAYPVNINYLPSEDDTEEIIDTENLNIITLFKNYISQVELEPVYKDKLYDSFIELYNNYKEQGQ